MLQDLKIPRLKTSARWVLLACGLVLGLRLAFWMVLAGSPGHFMAIDSPSYLNPAQALVETGRYLHAPDPAAPPETLRTPGYPLWLAGVMVLLGPGPNTLVFSQLVLFAGTLLFTGLLTQKLFGPRAVLPAVLLLGLDPASLTYNFLILSETLTAFLLSGFAWGLAAYLKEPGPARRILPAATALALATLVRPTTYYFLPLLLAVLAWHLRKREVGFNAVLCVLGILILPSLLLVGGWQVRNWTVTGTAVFTTVEGEGLYLWKGAQIVASNEGVDFKEAQSRLRERLVKQYPDYPRLPQPEQNRIMREEGKKLLRQNPLTAAGTHLIHSLYFFLSPGTTQSFWRLLEPDFSLPSFDWRHMGTYLKETLRSHPAFVLSASLGLGFLVILYAGVAAGLTGEGNAARAVLVFLVVYICLVTSFVHGQPRYRVAVMPILCALSAGGWSLMVRRFLPGASSRPIALFPRVPEPQSESGMKSRT